MLAISPGYKSSAMMNLYLRHPSFFRPQDPCSQFICSKGSKSFAMSNLLFHHPSSYALMGTPRAVSQFICGKGSKSCSKVNRSSSALMKAREALNIDSESGLPEVMDHHPCFSALAETPGALTIYSKSGSTDVMETLGAVSTDSEAGSCAVASPIGSRDSESGSPELMDHHPTASPIGSRDSESGSPELMDHHPCFSALAETPGALTIYSKSGSTEVMETLGIVSAHSEAGSLAVASSIGATKVRDWRSMTDADFKREVADILAKSCDDISSLLPDNEWDDFCWRRGMLIQKSFEKLARLYKNVDLSESLHIMRRNYNTSSKVKADIHPVDARKKNVAAARKEKKSNIQKIRM